MPSDFPAPSAPTQSIAVPLGAAKPKFSLQSFKDHWQLIAGVAGGVGLLFLLAVIAICYRRKKAKNAALEKQDQEVGVLNEMTQQYPTLQRNPTTVQEAQPPYPQQSMYGAFPPAQQPYPTSTPQNPMRGQAASYYNSEMGSHPDSDDESVESYAPRPRSATRRTAGRASMSRQSLSPLQMPQQYPQSQPVSPYSQQSPYAQPQAQYSQATRPLRSPSRARRY